ncbi:DUF917 family protein, partial [Candidatus Bathyarchaeota archaeon]|nr:DUF917 family protein [Candidatus Bathyarchaeota archaeon]
LSLSKCIQLGKILRKAVEPLKAVLKETNGTRLFEGIVKDVKLETQGGFTFVNIQLVGTEEYSTSLFEMKAKNEVLAAYRDGKLVAIAPDIITPVSPETGKCVTAERIEKGDKLAVIGLPAPEKWRTRKGLELWKEVLLRTGINENYVPL